MIQDDDGWGSIVGMVGYDTYLSVRTAKRWVCAILFHHHRCNFVVVAGSEG